MQFKNFTLITLLLVSFACTEDRFYEDNYDFNNRIWTIDEVANFSVEVDSTGIPYQLFINIRNTIDYPYRNMYVQYTLLDSTDIVEQKLINLKLFESKSGKPLGKSQSGIFSHQILLNDSVYFPTKGNYRLQFKQYMRRDSLPGMVSTGVKLLR